ncbi:MAG TPA: hypothetical protein VM689_25830 [Aliidongia sp.]|nr:hypothetical protein [Aliidongia sp.]
MPDRDHTRPSARGRIGLLLAAFPILCFAAMAFVGGGSERAEAAAFCLVANNMAPQCNYETVQQCQQQSENPGFGCIPNPNEMQQVFGSSRYCVATEQRIEYCLFSEYGACNTDAQRRRGVCYDSGAIGPTDPFQYDTRKPAY